MAAPPGGHYREGGKARTFPVLAPGESLPISHDLELIFPFTCSFAPPFSASSLKTSSVLTPRASS